ncbi:MAG: 4Fe-4S dicluster domain-containing protein [Clostridium butyricum]|nr:4Fe-4S dicluster domain-containing protein [Clostridium butyricum]
MKKGLVRKQALVNKEYCVGCGSCIQVCPLKAISINNGTFAMVDINKCVGCGKCAYTCPASTIEILTISGGVN